MPRKLRPYLAGPIAGCTDDEAAGWRDAVTEHFRKAINPMCRDYRQGDALAHQREIVELDKRDILRSDCVVVRWDHTKAMTGTTMEVIFAWENRVPVVLWIDPKATLSPWLAYHSTFIVHSFVDVIDAVDRCGRK